MNGRIKKNFLHKSFLRYKKISKKAVKLGSFLQCSVHIFLGHDGYFWNECDSIIFPKTFSFESSKQLLDLCPADSRTFWQVLEPIHKFIIEIHVLQCLFVRGSNKKTKEGKDYFKFHKRRVFHHLWQPSAPGGNLAMCLFKPSKKPKKAFLHPSVPFSLAKQRICLSIK